MGFLDWIFSRKPTDDEGDYQQPGLSDLPNPWDDPEWLRQTADRNAGRGVPLAGRPDLYPSPPMRPMAAHEMGMPSFAGVSGGASSDADFMPSFGDVRGGTSLDRMRRPQVAEQAGPPLSALVGESSGPSSDQIVGADQLRNNPLPAGFDNTAMPMGKGGGKHDLLKKILIGLGAVGAGVALHKLGGPGALEGAIGGTVQGAGEYAKQKKEFEQKKEIETQRNQFEQQQMANRIKLQQEAQAAAEEAHLKKYGIPGKALKAALPRFPWTPELEMRTFPFEVATKMLEQAHQEAFQREQQAAGFRNQKEIASIYRTPASERIGAREDLADRQREDDKRNYVMRPDPLSMMLPSPEEQAKRAMLFDQQFPPRRSAGAPHQPMVPPPAQNAADPWNLFSQ